MAYDAKAQEFAYGFYARGWSRDRAVPEIRKTYAGFSRSTWDEWEKTLGWKERRAAVEAKLRALEDDMGNINRSLLLDLDGIRKNLLAQHAANQADMQVVYAIASVSKRISDLTKQHAADRDGHRVEMEVLHGAIDALLAALQGIPGVAPVLKAHAGEIGTAVEKVAERFGANA